MASETLEDFVEKIESTRDGNLVQRYGTLEICHMIDLMTGPVSQIYREGVSFRLVELASCDVICKMNRRGTWRRGCLGKFGEEKATKKVWLVTIEFVNPVEHLERGEDTSHVKCLVYGYKWADESKHDRLSKILTVVDEKKQNVILDLYKVRQDICEHAHKYFVDVSSTCANTIGTLDAFEYFEKLRGVSDIALSAYFDINKRYDKAIIEVADILIGKVLEEQPDVMKVEFV